MRDFDLIIFDLDGVVVDSEALSCGCLLALLGEYGVEMQLDEVYRRFLGRGFKAVGEYFASLPSRLPADFRRRFESAVNEAFGRSLQSMPGIEDLLRSLRTPYCLASSSGLPRIALSLSVTGLKDYFATRIFAGEMVERGKPAPDLFLLAARTMAVDPARCLVVEDSVPGIEAGTAAGMTVWAFTGGCHLLGREAAAPVATSGADRIFDKMADLQQRLAG
jgi:HAD superfamily hydrolase (TIGR01509 family)